MNDDFPLSENEMLKVVKYLGRNPDDFSDFLAKVFAVYEHDVNARKIDLDITGKTINGDYFNLELKGEVSDE